MKKFWIDTDLVADDIVAIAMLLADSDKVELAGVSTISSHENLHKITRDAKELFETAGKKDV